jgi:NDP-sugar pyrophosphorylase family protein
VPKLLVPICDRPFFEYQIANLREQNIKDIVVCAGFLGERIKEEFGDGTSHGVRIRYSFDGPSLLGTGGAIKRAIPLLGDTFFVLYGDSFLQIDYEAVFECFRRSGRSALMTIFRNDNRWDTSNVEFADSEIKAYDKKKQTERMAYIDYGLSIYRATVFESYPSETAIDLSDILRDLVATGDLAGYEAKSRFYEVGSFSGIEEFVRAITGSGVGAAADR